MIEFFFVAAVDTNFIYLYEFYRLVLWIYVLVTADDDDDDDASFTSFFADVSQ